MKKTMILTCCALLPVITLLGCGGSTHQPLESAEVCSPSDAVTTVSDLNYPDETCAEATALAEARVDSGHYRRACQESAPESSLPTSVTAAHVTDCRTTDGRGVFLDVEICCPESVDETDASITVVRAEGPSCPDWRTLARADHLHYPDAASCGEIISRAEEDLQMAHYRRACKDAAPRATRPAQVLEARVVECRSGGASGVVVDVELCCNAKVFEEKDFRELVWQRPPEEIRAVLGEPQKITQWPRGPHWNYPLEVARDDRVFAEVTVVFVDGRVDSYSF